MPISRRSVLALTMLVTSVPALAAEPKTAFIKSWEHRPVTLRRTLYNLVYNERARFMPLVKRDGKSAGLTVATPTDTYYRFEARREGEQDVIDRDPARVVALLHDRYRRSAHLDTGTTQDIEAVMLVRFDPGVAMTVQRISINGDEVRIALRTQGENTRETMLTIKWPAPLSRELSEAPLIETALTRFLTKS